MLSIVAPVYNEEASIATFIDRCANAAARASVDRIELVLVNDGSRDRSVEIIRQKQREYPGLIRLVELSRNFGQQSAYHGGLSVARGDLVVTLDSDLQDPPELIPDLVAQMAQGFDVVYARRVGPAGSNWGASGHSGLKSFGAFIFHFLISHMKRNPIPRDVGEFRCMNRSTVDALLALPEYLIFLPGLVAYLGHRAGFVDYVRNDAHAGGRMRVASLTIRALDALTTFTVMPINLIVFLALAAWAIVAGVFMWWVVALIRGGPGEAMRAFGWFAGTLAWCITVNALAVIGHYVGRVFFEVKRRPRYMISRITD